MRAAPCNVYASTGFVGPEASEYWGSNQAAVALAIWSTTTRVLHYPAPTTCRSTCSKSGRELIRGPTATPLVHVHYHWLFTEADHQRGLAASRQLGAAQDRLDWLTARLPLH